jgi:hypothetical protein
MEVSVDDEGVHLRFTLASIICVPSFLLSRQTSRSLVISRDFQSDIRGEV